MTLQKRAPENFRSCRWGDERTVKRAQTVSEDPHRRERKLNALDAFLYANIMALHFSGLLESIKRTISYEKEVLGGATE